MPTAAVESEPLSPWSGRAVPSFFLLVIALNASSWEEIRSLFR